MLKITFELDDPQLEVDLDLARQDYNKRADPPIDTNEDWVIKESRFSLEQYRGIFKRVLNEKVTKLKDADLAEVAAFIDSKLDTVEVKDAIRT